MQNQGSVILRLDNDQGLWGWKCFVFKGDLLYPIALRLSNNVSIEFQTTKLKYAETIYWCTNKDQSQRSNQVVLRISGRRSIPADSGLIFHDELKCRVHFYPLWKFEHSFSVVTFTAVQYWLEFLSL